MIFIISANHICSKFSLPTPSHEQMFYWIDIFISVNTTKVSGNMIVPHNLFALFSSTQPTLHTTTAVYNHSPNTQLTGLEETQEKWLKGKKKERKESRINAGITPTRTMYNFHFRKERGEKKQQEK